MSTRCGKHHSSVRALRGASLAFGSIALAALPSHAGPSPTPTFEPWCDIGAFFDKSCSIGGGPAQASCEITRGQDVTYIYSVQVFPARAVFEVTDDKLGVIGQTSGGTLTRTVTLTETTTNHAQMRLVSIDPECYLIGAECCDEVTVTVLDSTPTPSVEPTPTPSPSFTPTAVSTPTSTPAPTCADLWPVTQVCTLGKGQSRSNNPKLVHCITGNVVDPSAVGPTAHRIPVCRGTGVTAVVTDHTGTPTNTSDGSLSCTTTGCTGVVNVVEKYKSVSQDGKDTDRMTLLPN